MYTMLVNPCGRDHIDVLHFLFVLFLQEPTFCRFPLGVRQYLVCYILWWPLTFSLALLLTYFRGSSNINFTFHPSNLSELLLMFSARHPWSSSLDVFDTKTFKGCRYLLWTNGIVCFFFGLKKCSHLMSSSMFCVLFNKCWFLDETLDVQYFAISRKKVPSSALWNRLSYI